MQKVLYQPFVSQAKNKKYSVYVLGSNQKPKLIHFGDVRYEQYFDRIGHYSYLNHRDAKRRKAYYARHGPTTNRNSAKYWSHKCLW